MSMKLLAIAVVVGLLALGLLARAHSEKKKSQAETSPAGCDTVCTVPHKKTEREDFPVTRTETEWRRVLTPEQYRILREKGTERAFTGAYWNNHETGMYRCAACEADLFSSSSKFDSGTGWPSFYEPVSPSAVHTEQDSALGMVRTEILCGRCGGHLGHVFEDGPRPTGLRYCINSASLKLEKAGD